MGATKSFVNVMRVRGWGRRFLQGAVVVAVAASVPGAWVAGMEGRGAWGAGVEVNNVAAGSAAVTRAGSVTTVTTGSRNTIINYQRMDVGVGESLRFVQPTAQSRVLNRIQSAVPTSIDGTMWSNGRVYIVNPAGVVFGNGAVVDVGRLYAAAGHLSDANFLAGVNRFTDNTGIVRNQGVLRADQIHLVGGNVANFGQIVTNGAGIVTLTAGKDVYIAETDTPTGSARILVKVSSDKSQVKEGTGVSNEGTVDAGQGLLSMGAGDIYAAGIYNKGTLKGANIAVNSGASTNVNEGTIDASNATGKGGEVELLGDKVGVFAGTVDASGATGGGTIKIGGDFHGDSATPAASVTVVGPEATIKADAIESGDGGQVAVWADGQTRFYGLISAGGGALGGNGGFVEVSGKDSLVFDGMVQLGAVNGSLGRLLLDPGTLTISHGASATNDTHANDLTILAIDGGTNSTFTISDTKLNSLSGVISLAAQEDVVFNAGVSLNWTGSTSLSVQAVDGNVTLNTNGSNHVTINTAGGIVSLTAGGAMGLEGNTSITTNGGAISLTADGIVTLHGGASLDSGGGNITFKARDVSLTNNVIAAGSSGVLAFEPYSSANGIVFGTGTAGSNMTIRSTDLGNFASAGTLRLGATGNVETGTISVTGISLASGLATTALEINADGTGGVVTVNALSLGGSLRIRGGAITVTGPMNAGSGAVNVSGTNLASSGTGTITGGQVTLVTTGTMAELTLGVPVVASGALSITGSGTNGVTTGALTGSSATINGAGGAVTVSGAVNAADGFNSTGSGYFWLNGGSITATSGPVTVWHGGSITLNGPVSAGTGAVNIDGAVIGTDGSGSVVGGSIGLTSGAGIGDATNALTIGSGAGTASVTAAGTTGVYLSVFGAMSFAGISNASAVTRVTAAGDIEATGPITGTTILLDAGGGIGMSGAVGVVPSLASTLTTAGAGSAGNIHVAASAGALGLLTMVTGTNGTQTVTVDLTGNAAVASVNVSAADVLALSATGNLSVAGAAFLQAGLTFSAGGSLTASGATLSALGGVIALAAGGSMDVSVATINAGAGTVSLRAGTSGAGAINGTGSVITGGVVTMQAGVGSTLNLTDATVTAGALALRAGTGSESAMINLTNTTLGGALAVLALEQDLDLTSFPAVGAGGTLTLISDNGNVTIAGDQNVAALTARGDTITLGGNATVSGDMALMGTVVLTPTATVFTGGGSSNLTITGPVSGGSTFLTTNFGGTTAITGNVAVGTLTMGGGTIALGGSATVAGNMALTGTVVLTGAAGTLAGGGASNLTITGPVAAPGTFLTTNFGGLTTLAGDVTVGTLTVAAAGGNVVIGSGVAGLLTTTGAVSIGEDLSLNGGLTVSSSGGAVTFGGTIDSASDSPLTVNTAGTIWFQGNVGLGGVLGGLTTTGGGVTRLGLGGTAITVQVGSPIDFGGDVVLFGDTTLTAGGGTTGTVTFGGTVNSSASQYYTLTVNADDVVAFRGNVGGGTGNLGELTVNATAAGVILGSGPAMAVLTQQGGTGLGRQNYNGPVALNGNTTLNGQELNFAEAVGASNYDLTLVSDVVSFGAAVTGTGTHVLTLRPAGAGDDVFIGGGVVGLGSLVLAAAQVALIGGFGTVTIGRADGTGTIDVMGATTFTGMTVRLWEPTGLITISAPLTAGAVRLEAAGVELTNLVDAAGGLSSTGSGYFWLNGGSITASNGPVSVAQGGSITLDGPVAAGGLVTLNGATISGNASGTILGGTVTLQATGSVSLAALANSSGPLSITANGIAVGALTALSVTLNGGTGLVTLGGAVTSGGGTGPVSLTGAGVLQTGGVITAGVLTLAGTGTFTLLGNNQVGTLTGAVTGAVSYNNAASMILTNMTAGGGALAVTVAGANILSAASVSAHSMALNSASGTIALGSSLTTSGGAIALTGAVELGGGGPITLQTWNSGTGSVGAITIDGTVDATGGETLILLARNTANTNAMSLNGVVGGAVPLAGLTAAGSSLTLQANISTTGAVDFGGVDHVYVAPTSVTIATNGGAVTVSGAVDALGPGVSNLTIDTSAAGAAAAIVLGSVGQAGASGGTFGNLTLTALGASNGSMQISGPVTLIGALTSSGRDFTNTGAISAVGATLAQSGAINFLAAVNANGGTLIAAGGTITSGSAGAITGRDVSLTASSGGVALGGPVAAWGLLLIGGQGVTTTPGATLTGLSATINGGTGAVTLGGVVNATNGLTVTTSGIFTLSATGAIVTNNGPVTVSPGTGAVILNGSISALNGAVNIEGASVSSIASGVILGGAITLHADAGAVSLAAPVAGSDVLTLTGSNGVSAVALTGTSATINGGTGAVILTGVVNVPGGFTSIASGLFTLSAAGSILTTDAPVTITHGGLVTVNGAVSAGGGTVNLSGAGIVMGATSSAVTGRLAAFNGNGGDVTIDGTVLAANGFSSTGSGFFLLNSQGSIQTTNAPVTIAHGGTITFNGPITAGSGALTVTGVSDISFNGITSAGVIALTATTVHVNGSMSGTSLAATGALSTAASVIMAGAIDVTGTADVDGALTSTGGAIHITDDVTGNGTLSASTFVNLGGGFAAGGGIVATNGSVSIAGAVTMMSGRSITAGTAIELGSANMSGNLYAGTTIGVGGAATIQGNMTAGGAIAFSAGANLRGNATAGGVLSITGAATLSGTYNAPSVSVPGSITLAGDVTLNTAGTAGILLGNIVGATSSHLMMVASNAASTIMVGNIGSESDPIGDLTFNADGLVSLGHSQSTAIYANGITFASSTGDTRLPSDRATIICGGNLVLVGKGIVDFGVNEKLTVYDATLPANNAPEVAGSAFIWGQSPSSEGGVVLGDVAVEGRLIVMAGATGGGTIKFRNRPAGPVQTNGGIVTDTGADIYALDKPPTGDFVLPSVVTGDADYESGSSFNFMATNYKVDNSRATAVSSAGKKRFLIGNANGASPGEDAENKWFTGAISLENKNTLLFVSQYEPLAVADFVDIEGARDIRVDGQVRVPVAAFGSIIPRDTQTITPERGASISGALREYLKELGIYARDLRPEELVEYLIGRGLYDDVPYELNPGQGSFKVAVNRLPNSPILSLVDKARRLLTKAQLDENGKPVLDEQGKPKMVSQKEDVARAIGVAWAAYAEDAAGKGQEPQPLRFRAYLEAHATEVKFALALNYLNQIRDLLLEIRNLGLTSSEFEVSETKLLEPLRITDLVSKEQFRQMIEGPSGKAEPEQTAAQTVPAVSKAD